MARMREGGSGRKPLGEIKASPSPKAQIDRVIGELKEIKKALPVREEYKGCGNANARACGGGASQQTIMQ